MTISELLEEKYIKGHYDDYEIYKYTGKNHKIHTDSIKFLHSWENEGDFPNLDLEVYDYKLMDEEDYNNTIQANACDYADFETWYGSKNAIVLIIVLHENCEVI